jgi:hypothetical protein
VLPLSSTLGDTFRNEVVAETDEEGRKLEALGTRRATSPATPTSGIEVFGDAEIDSIFVGELARRGVAGLYDDVLAGARESTRFLALWRTLEFAFRAEGKKLTDLLLGYPRVAEMEFDRAELEELRAIRGRLSHAVSGAGLAPLHQADALALTKLGRLWSLVDWIVLSKRGTDRSADADELAPLQAFIDRGGRMKLVDDTRDPGDWLQTWSRWNPRFRH